MKIAAWLVWGMAAAVAAAAAGESAREDARVKRALEEEGLKYRIDENWNFLLTFEGVEEDRTHVVVVKSGTERMGASEIREVYAVGYQGKPLGKAQLEELLEANARYIMGAWEVSPVETDADNRRVQQARFCIRLDAEAPGETLRTALEIAADICDAREAEWMEGDDW